ncbi:TIGR01457 family HAD-type hydrolase [Thalassobacillus devorans]|uniref:TIGR01457 family HAD-type hydrolase n=1 Tax=Thalassobacillus devorans TaxID=279813 RepID=UPI00048D20E3|nr:TIGR01457 family HAD-type hydrolase [Thalassobacillus devorans]
MKNYRAYLIDLDGTMYRGTERIEAASDFIKKLNNKKLPHLFVTNNSSRRPEQVADKLNHMDIPAAKEQVYTTSMATAQYIKDQHPGADVYAIGEEGLLTALKEAGLNLVEENADYVIIGIDRGITYDKLAAACLNVRNGAVFLSTNGDVAIPTEQGMLPGNGSLTSVVTVSTGVEPVFIGKPEPIIMEQAMQTLGYDKNEVLMVGDNYNTDIKAGMNAGIDTLMVFTGVTSKEDLSNYNQQPTYTVDSLEEWITRL